MNKKMIALAVAGVMAAPIASAAPTVYGRAQVELATTDCDSCDSERGTIDNGLGRIGLKGSEDLGNGLKALYKFEFKADTTDNTTGANKSKAALTGRDSFVGLKGNFGTVSFGRHAGVYKKTNLDGYIATTLEARNFGGQTSGSFGHAGFISDSIVYSNKFGAVKFGALIRGSDADGAGDSQVAFDYKAGPLRIVAAVSSDEKVAPADDNDKTKFAVQYKMGPWKFTAQTETEDNTTINFSELDPDAPDVDTAIDTDYMLLQADYTMGKNTFTLRVAEEEYDDGTDTVTNEVTMLGITHKMSKKTRVFAGIRDHDIEGFGVSVTTFGMRVDF